MIVVDTSVLAYALMDGPATAQARRAREIDPDWRVPPLCRHQFLNVLASYVRRRGTTLARARTLWAAAEAVFAAAEHPIDMDLALSLAARYDVSAYDAEFIALAVALDTVCVTSDRQLLRTFPAHTRSLGEFSS